MVGRWISRVVVMIILVCATPVWAGDPVLFKEYTAGLSREAVVKKSGGKECDIQAGEPSVCLEGFRFWDVTWEVGFRFIGGKLVEVVFVAPFSQQTYTSAFKAISAHFELLVIKSGNDSLDIVELSRRAKNNAEITQAVNNAERVGLGRSDITYGLFEREKVKVLFGKAANLTDLVAKMPEDCREIDFSVKAEGQTGVCMIQFTVPKTTLKLIQNIKGKK